MHQKHTGSFCSGTNKLGTWKLYAGGENPPRVDGVEEIPKLTRLSTGRMPGEQGAYVHVRVPMLVVAASQHGGEQVASTRLNRRRSRCELVSNVPDIVHPLAFMAHQAKLVLNKLSEKLSLDDEEEKRLGTFLANIDCKKEANIVFIVSETPALRRWRHERRNSSH